MKFRITRQKKEILNVIKQNHLITAVSLCEILKEIDAATIYRNLKKFEEMEVVKSVGLPDGSVGYEVNEDGHQHILCKICGKVESFDLPEFIKIPKNFSEKCIELTIKGKCNDCVC